MAELRAGPGCCRRGTPPRARGHGAAPTHWAPPGRCRPSVMRGRGDVIQAARPAHLHCGPTAKNTVHRKLAATLWRHGQRSRSCYLHILSLKIAPCLSQARTGARQAARALTTRGSARACFATAEAQVVDATDTKGGLRGLRGAEVGALLLPPRKPSVSCLPPPPDPRPSPATRLSSGTLPATCNGGAPPPPPVS
jgi:hypothetical protein